MHVHISEALGGVIVGSGATIVASALQIGASAVARRGDRRATQTRELTLAMREYLATLDLLVEELRGVPSHPRSRLGDRLDRQLYAIARAPRPQQLGDRLAATAAHLRLIAPATVDALMQDVQAHTRDYRPGDDDWFAEWAVLRAEVRDGFKSALSD